MPAQVTERTKDEGIYRVHKRGCPGARTCGCPKRYQAAVYNPATRRPVRKNFDSVKAAKLWRGDLMNAVARGVNVAPAKLTVQQAADELLAGMRDGSIVNRSRRPYKPAAIRSYDRALRLRVLPVF